MSFLPVRDDNPTRTTPVVNRALIALCFLAFSLQILLGTPFVVEWSFIPARLTAFLVGNADPLAPLTLITAMFLHGGWGHILGNLLFLWLFGDNIEDAYGHLGYLAFYLACGALSFVAQYVTAPTSPVINLGASGAISAVMGAYILMYPRATVQIFFFPLSLLSGSFGVPAWLMLGLWFITQLSPAIQSLGQMSGGGVAYWAHICGFVAGLLITLALRPRRHVAPAFHTPLRQRSYRF